MNGQDLLDSAEQAVRAAGELAGQLVDQGRLRRRLAELRARTDEHLRRVGGMMYDTHTGSPVSTEDLVAELRAIDELKRQTADLEARLPQSARRSICPWCGGAAEPGDVFCRDCGRKL